MSRFTETAVGSTGYVAAQGYAPPKGNTVETSGYSSADICGYRLPCGLCLMMEKPCPAHDVQCSDLDDLSTDAEELVTLVEEWSAAHPRKTRQSVFLEQWPQADIDNTGLLILCPKRISADIRVTVDCLRKGCSDCRREFWMQEVE